MKKCKKKKNYPNSSDWHKTELKKRLYRYRKGEEQLNQWDTIEAELDKL